jgi:hypothetical protein
MNIKRALLAAVAVLMVPGYAMAQSTNTFATAIVPAEAGTPDMTITCNGGIPLTQTAPAGTTFTVTELQIGTVCTVVMVSDLDADWMAYSYWQGTDINSITPNATDYCEFTVADGNTAWVCAVEAIPTDFTYEVSVMWDISPEADPGIGENAEVSFTCNNVWTGGYVNGSLTTVTDTFDASSNVVESISGTPSPTTPTTCSAYLMGYGSAVEVENGCMPPVTVPVGAGTVSCTISATAFYEGIPTLSQYGMAIMALLMLGVGFVGFRRFV